jgi:hypothetical protein
MAQGLALRASVFFQEIADMLKSCMSAPAAEIQE